jgi:hypothetical protein
MIGSPLKKFRNLIIDLPFEATSDVCDVFSFSLTETPMIDPLFEACSESYD